MSVEWNDALVGRLELAAYRGVVRGGAMLLQEGNRLITSPPKTGRIYRRRGVSHQASAPGQPPASDTGRLVQSGRTENSRPLLSSAALWSTVYAAPLEYGTARMEARPYARPALSNKFRDIVEAVRQEIEAEVGSATTT